MPPPPGQSAPPHPITHQSGRFQLADPSATPATGESNRPTTTNAFAFLEVASIRRRAPWAFTPCGIDSRVLCVCSDSPVAVGRGAIRECRHNGRSKRCELLKPPA